MAFKVGNSQSINTDVQNLQKRFTDDGIPYMYGSYKHTDQLFRSGGDDIRTSSTGSSEGGTVMRSYMASISDGTSENMRTPGNPFDVAYPVTSTTSPYGDQFISAAGRLFIGAPSYSYTNYTSVNGRGGVMIVYPQRIKTSADLNNATLVSTAYDFITGQSTLGLNNNAFGSSLAYAGGKLFVGAPYVDSSMGAVVQVGPGNYNDGNGPTLTTYAKPNVGDGPSMSETSLVFFGKSIGAGNGKIAVSDGEGRVFIRGINYTNSGTPTNSSIETGSGWKKIVGPKGESPSSGSEFGSKVVVSCGRIVVGDWAWNGPSGQLPTNSGAFHLYDLNGNFIRTVQNPDPTSTNHFFGWNVSVGSGRIVTTSAVTKALYIFNMDGDLVKKVDNPAGQGNCPAGAYAFSSTITTTVGFGRIFFSMPYFDHNSKTDTGIVIGYDLDGNYLGYIYGSGSTLGSSGYNFARFGQGGIQVAPGRLYVVATANSATVDGPMIHETPLHTAMTPYEVQAMEDGDL